jgi:hypothetical protein
LFLAEVHEALTCTERNSDPSEGVATNVDMNRYWWITLLPVGWTKEESAAGVRLYVAALAVFLAIAIPLGRLATTFAMATDLGLSLLFLSLIPAFLLARPIICDIHSRPSAVRSSPDCVAKD